MGRKKPGKPRRAKHPREYTLQELQPPGSGYEEWIRVRPGMDPSRIDDPRLGSEALALMHCFARLGPLYKGNVPMAAVFLDLLLDTGHLPVFDGDENGGLVPLEEMAAMMYGDVSHDSVRDSIHRLHATGALLVVTDDGKDVHYVRMVAKRPEEPGQPWQFVGDPNVVVSTVCVSKEIWEELPVDVATAAGFMRACRSQLEEPDPAVYGKHAGVNGTEHARELFAAAQASGYVDYKGCDACPAGHLCTREV
jgi:hypothetical protein